MACVGAKCCPEWTACLASGEACSEGGMAGEGEIICIQDCIFAAVAGGGVPDNDTKLACAAACSTGGSPISAATNALFTCMNGGCPLECFGG